MRSFILLANMLWVNWLSAATPAEILQHKLDSIKTMQATFLQIVSSKSSQISQSSGTMALKRPGKFRWETQKPAMQLVVADGSKIWVYDEDLEQATVRAQEDTGGMAALFLSGSNEQIARDFEVATNNSRIFDLNAKSERENFRKVQLEFAGDALIGMVLFDQLGQRTVIKLQEVKINPDLDARLFNFSPPNGVDVVQQ